MRTKTACTCPPIISCEVASSTHRENILTGLRAIGSEHLFSAVVSAEDVASGKPDPEVFLKSAAAIRRDPRRCLVFEDAIVGIQAGQAAGMKVVAVATTNTLSQLSGADIAVETLEHVDWQTLESMYDSQS